MVVRVLGFRVQRHELLKYWFEAGFAEILRMRQHHYPALTCHGGLQALEFERAWILLQAKKYSPQASPETRMIRMAPLAEENDDSRNRDNMFDPTRDLWSEVE